MAYDINGQPYDPTEHASSGVLKMVFLAIAAILVIAACGSFLSCQPQEQETGIAHPETGIVRLEIPTTNAAMMHRFGLPTKADVMQWHMSGQWGFWRDGSIHAYDELPGEGTAWDELYGIDPDNPAFDK